MRTFSLFCFLSIFIFTACEEADPVFPTDVFLSCQEDVDEIAPLIADAIFDFTDPLAGFKGNVFINSSTNDCDSPITDLSFFQNHIFWLGSITIESDDITNLDFLANVEQVRSGLIIRNCPNLEAIELPRLAEIQKQFDVNNNPLLERIVLGNDHPEVYERIFLDSVIINNNPMLTSWTPGNTDVVFGRSARIISNESLTDLSGLRNLEMPRNTMELELNGTFINEDGINTDLDSLNMPFSTLINALEGDNDYSWLSMAKITPIFPLEIEDMQVVDLGRIDDFIISGEVTIPELCPLASIADTTSLQVFPNVGSISIDSLEAQCL